MPGLGKGTEPRAFANRFTLIGWSLYFALNGS